MSRLLDQIDGKISLAMTDGAYDGASTYQSIAQYGEHIEVIIPPRVTAVSGVARSAQNQRDRHLDMINTHGRLSRQTETDYGRRALVETTMGRYKPLIGPRLQAREFEAQQTKAAIGVTVLNRMLAAGRTHPVRCKRQAA